MNGNLPALPTDPTLKTFVVLSSLGLIAFTFSAFQGWRNRSMEQRLWALSPLLFSIATFVVARASLPMVHRTLSILVLGLATRNAIRMTGRERWAPAIGALLWLSSVILARVMFG